ncbi:MAG: M48 family metalloprotease [Pseudomonadota bacterium]
MLKAKTNLQRGRSSGLVAAFAAATAVMSVAGATVAHAQGLPLIRDTEIEDLLSDYARPIFSVAGLGDGRVSIRIVRSSSFNAFVLDGRNVFMHTGALQQADTPNQVIGVIAHEAGHITGGHMAALRNRIRRDQTRILLMRILGIGAAIATGNAAASVAGDQLILRSLLAERRSQESAADQAALDFLRRTRQSGRGMLETFERFARQEFDTNQDPFVRSHPIAARRIATLRRTVVSSPHFKRRDPPQLQLRHDLMRAKLTGYLESPAVTFNRYPRRDNSLPARYARVIGSFVRGGRQGLNASISGVNALIAEKPRNPHFQELRGDLLMRAGRAVDAIPSLRRALALKPKAPLIKVQLGSALLQLNVRSKVNEAVRLLRSALAVDVNPRAYGLLATAFYRQGKPALANAATAQASFVGGNLKRAKQFAQRAKPALKRGSVWWVRMDDILNTKS